MFNVKDYGAAGDGTTLDNEAINSAIAACNDAGGGTVLLPAGNYLCASIHLKSNVNLHIDSGATILAADENSGLYDYFSDDQRRPEDHYETALIWGVHLKNVMISGHGTIDGRGADGGLSKSSGFDVGGGDKGICIVESRNITLKNFTILDAGHYAIRPEGCDTLLIDSVKINTRRDGIGIFHCQNVTVSNCYVNSIRYDDGLPDGGDDAISLKSTYTLDGKTMVSKNITVKNCEIWAGCAALYFGSMTYENYENITFKDIEICHAGKAGISINSNDGATLNNILFENITMKHVATPLLISMSYKGRSTRFKTPGVIKNVTIRNITATNVCTLTHRASWTSTINGVSDKYPIGPDILLENIKITYKGGGTLADAKRTPPEKPLKPYYPRYYGKRSSYAFYVRYANGITFCNVETGFEKDDLRPAVICKNVTGMTIENFKAERAEGADMYNVILRNCKSCEIEESPSLTVHFQE